MCVFLFCAHVFTYRIIPVAVTYEYYCHHRNAAFSTHCANTQQHTYDILSSARQHCFYCQYRVNNCRGYESPLVYFKIRSNFCFQVVGKSFNLLYSLYSFLSRSLSLSRSSHRNVPIYILRSDAIAIEFLHRTFWKWFSLLFWQSN